MSSEIEKTEDHQESTSAKTGSSATLHSVELEYKATYSGPLPHPEILRRFEEIVPGSAKEIFDDFKLQSAHRRSIEAKAISSDALSQNIGSIAGGLVGIIGVSGGLWLAHEGKAAGLASIFGTLASLVGVYIYQRRHREAEIEEKSPAPARKNTR